MKRQEYLELKKRHQEEFDKFPIAYAFNDKQLDEALKKLGATREECVSVFGHGDVVRKEDARALLDLLDRQRDEVMRRILDDQEFAYEAFLYEMENHEYYINLDGDDDVLDCFNLTFEKLNRYGLQYAWRKAREQHLKDAQDWELI